MQSLLILTIFVTGTSGIFAQVLILRELLVVFGGNELTIGIIIANWVFTEALGALFIGKLIDRLKEKSSLLICLGIIFVLALPVSIYSIRATRLLFGVEFGEVIGLWGIFWVSLLSNLIPGFCHGGLFSALAKIYSSFVEQAVKGVGRVYAWEALGSLAGGVAVTYIAIPYLNSFQSVFIVALSNLVLFIFLQRYILDQRVKRVMLTILLGLVALFLFLPSGYLQQTSLSKQWKEQEILAYRNSLYGNIVVTAKNKQTNFFYNAMPIITLPYPDLAAAEETGLLPLLFHRGPKKALVIGGGVGGVINQMLKYPGVDLDYLEQDPVLIQLLGRFGDSKTKDELASSRVRIINSDGRYFLKSNNYNYDLVLIGASKPTDLSTNRFFTREFFLSVQAKLNPGGILAFHLPGSLTYISPSLRDLNFAVLNSLKGVFQYIRVIPGDYNLYLASQNSSLIKLLPQELADKISRMSIDIKILLPAYLDYRLDKEWLDWFFAASKGATSKLNSDFAPFALFKMLALWNKQFSGSSWYVLKSVEYLNLPLLLFALCLFAMLFYYTSRKQAFFLQASLVYSIFTTGFFAMLVNLLLIFSFQVNYGYLYHQIGLLISLFIFGTAAASMAVTLLKNNRKFSRQLFIFLEAFSILFCYLIAWLLPRLAKDLPGLLPLYCLLLFLSGAFVGMAYPLALDLYIGKQKMVGTSAGILYFADLMGGWIAGMAGGVVLLPILGLVNLCIFISMVKLSSLFLVVLGVDKRAI